MIFWIIIPLFTILAVAFVVVPLLRANGTAEASTSAPSWSRQRVVWLVLGLAALVIIPAIGLYAFIGRPDLAAAEARGDAAGQSQAAGNSTPASSMSDMIVQLQDKVRQNPKDAESWQTLGWAFMHIRQPKDAAEAYRQAVSLAPDKAEYRSALAEASIQSGDGKISDEAAAQLRRVTAADPADARARFYLALYKDQQGDHRGAIADWITLLKSAPPGAVWAPEVRRVVVQVAKEQKLDVSAELPAVTDSATASSSANAPGPNAEQVAAAQKMSSADQSAMIHAMVEKLASQLKQNPHDAEGWSRLMRARMVLGEKDQALAAYHAARNAFAKEPEQLTTLENQARVLGMGG